MESFVDLRERYNAKLICDSTNGIFRSSNCKHLPFTQYRLSFINVREHFVPNGKNPCSPFTKIVADFSN